MYIYRGQLQLTKPKHVLESRHGNSDGAWRGGCVGRHAAVDAFVVRAPVANRQQRAQSGCPRLKKGE